MALVGFTLQPEDEFLARTARIALAADYVEIAPETTWFEAPDGTLHANGFHARFAEFVRETGKRCVAHGVALSLYGGDAKRRARWLARLRKDQTVFHYAWYTDHLGATRLGGENVALPVGVLPSAAVGRSVRRTLAAMATVVPDVGVENSALYFALGDPVRDDTRFLAQVLRDEHSHLLLDLHNLYTNALNLGFEPRDWLARVDLSRVIELHLSGGVDANPAWLPPGKTLRLDSHDSAVPEAVWALYEEVAPRCTRLRGVTLERMEGTVLSDGDATEVADELERARDLAARLP